MFSRRCIVGVLTIGVVAVLIALVGVPDKRERSLRQLAGQVINGSNCSLTLHEGQPGGAEVTGVTCHDNVVSWDGGNGLTDYVLAYTTDLDPYPTELCHIPEESSDNPCFQGSENSYTLPDEGFYKIRICTNTPGIYCWSEQTADQCQNSEDDDGDGFTDYDGGGGEPDLGCSLPTDTWEFDDNCSPGITYDLCIGPDCPQGGGSTGGGTAACGNEVVEAGEQCDQGNANGTSVSCCSPSCTFQSNTTVCRASAGVCDAEERCSGTSATCPSDSFKPNTTVCRASTDTSCDPAETCSGSSTCSSDVNDCSGTTGSTGGGVGVCGDGNTDAAEGCDDGNTADGDGCSSTCRIEDPEHCSWVCDTIPVPTASALELAQQEGRNGNCHVQCNTSASCCVYDKRIKQILRADTVELQGVGRQLSETIQKDRVVLEEDIVAEINQKVCPQGVLNEGESYAVDAYGRTVVFANVGAVAERCPRFIPQEYYCCKMPPNGRREACESPRQTLLRSADARLPLTEWGEPIPWDDDGILQEKWDERKHCADEAYTLFVYREKSQCLNDFKFCPPPEDTVCCGHFAQGLCSVTNRELCQEKGRRFDFAPNDQRDMERALRGCEKECGEKNWYCVMPALKDPNRRVPITADPPVCTNQPVCVDWRWDTSTRPWSIACEKTVSAPYLPLPGMDVPASYRPGALYPHWPWGVRGLGADLEEYKNGYTSQADCAAVCPTAAGRAPAWQPGISKDAYLSQFRMQQYLVAQQWLQWQDAYWEQFWKLEFFAPRNNEPRKALLRGKFFEWQEWYKGIRTEGAKRWEELVEGMNQWNDTANDPVQQQDWDALERLWDQWQEGWNTYWADEMKKHNGWNL